MLANIHRGKGNELEERSALVELTERSSDCREALLRLIEIDEKKRDWPSLMKWTELMQSINPMRSDLQQLRAQTYESLDNSEKAAQALAAFLELQPSDPANIHYRLARAFFALGKTDFAKRQALMALEESPRYKAALELLVRISKSAEPTTSEKQTTSEKKAESP